jgi:hypothetical protein
MTIQVQVAEVLNVHGADLNAVARYRGHDNATPLFSACWSSGNLALVRWLLDHGVPATDREFAAALGHFQRHGKGPTLLLKHSWLGACRLTAAFPVTARRCKDLLIWVSTERFPGSSRTVRM